MYFDVVSVICGTALVVVLAAIILRFSPEVTLRLWRYRPDDRSSGARAIDDQDGTRAPWTLWTPPEADAGTRQDESSTQPPHDDAGTSRPTSRE